MYVYILGFPSGSVVKKNPPADTGDAGLIPESGRSPGEENGNPVQYSCLGNLMDRGAWWDIVHEVAKEADTTTKTTFHIQVRILEKHTFNKENNIYLFFTPHLPPLRKLS